MTPRPTQCPSGHPLVWLTDNVATCAGHPDNLWRLRPRGGKLTGVWDKSAVELADSLQESNTLLAMATSPPGRVIQS